MLANASNGHAVLPAFVLSLVMSRHYAIGSRRHFFAKSATEESAAQTLELESVCLGGKATPSGSVDSGRAGQWVPGCRSCRSESSCRLPSLEVAVAANLHGQALPPDPAPPVMHGTGGRWRVWQVVVAAAVVAALLAGAGVFIGRVTQGGESGGRRWRGSNCLRRLSWADSGRGAVWTGSETIAWGGYARSENVGQASDGAAYNPATRTWRVIAPAPSGVQRDDGGRVAWTGDEMVVWASNSPDGPVGGAAYDPATDSWRRLPAGPLARREGYSSVWTGKELIVIGGTLGDTIAKPTAAGARPQSRHVAAAARAEPAHGPSPRRRLGWGEGLRRRPGAARPMRTASPPAGRSSSPTTPPPTRSARSRCQRLRRRSAQTRRCRHADRWTRTEVVFTAAAPGGGSVQIVRYNPTIDGWNGEPAASCHIVDKPAHGHGCRNWSKGPYAPCFIPGGYTQVAWLGDRYVAACGKNGSADYSLTTNTWRVITP